MEHENQRSKSLWSFHSPKQKNIYTLSLKGFIDYHLKELCGRT